MNAKTKKEIEHPRLDILNNVYPANYAKTKKAARENEKHAAKGVTT